MTRDSTKYLFQQENGAAMGRRPDLRRGAVRIWDFFHLSSLLFCGAALLLVSACGPLPGKPTAADVYLEPKQVKDFGELYRQDCAGCHGRDGQGNGALALANPVYLAVVSDDALQRATA